MGEQMVNENGVQGVAGRVCLGTVCASSFGMEGLEGRVSDLEEIPGTYFHHFYLSI